MQCDMFAAAKAVHTPQKQERHQDWSAPVKLTGFAVPRELSKNSIIRLAAVGWIPSMAIPRFME